jgi:hypothetical protein
MMLKNENEKITTLKTGLITPHYTVIQLYHLYLSLHVVNLA